MDPLDHLADCIYESRLDEFVAGLGAVSVEDLSRHLFSDGTTLLVVAVSEARVEHIAALIQLGVDVNVSLPSGSTAIAVAALWDVGLDVVDRLLTGGARPDEGIAGEGYTALTLAADRGDIALVRRLLDAGAAVEGTSRHMTPLILACHRRDAAMVELLLARGARPNRGADGMTPLEAAGDDAEIRRLLRR